MTAPPDDEDDTQDDPGRAARRAERVEVLGDLIRAGRDLALQAAAASLAGTPLPAPDAHLAFLRACREVRQAVSLQARLDGDLRHGSGGGGAGGRAGEPSGRGPLEPGPRAAAMKGQPLPPPGAESGNPRVEHVRACVRCIIAAIPPEREDAGYLARLLDERLADPDILEDVADGRDPTLLVGEVCQDLAIPAGRSLPWPDPPDWAPRQPDGVPRSAVRSQLRSRPPDRGGG